MKEWWISLTLRDKRIAILGGVVVIIASLYAVVLQPLMNANKTLREEVQQNKALLVWMQKANDQLQQLQKKPIHTNNHSLLSRVQNELNKTPLMNQLKDLKQSEYGSVQLHFQTVSFDELMTWLINIEHEQKLVVSQIHIDSMETPGVVSGEMVLNQ
jgi:general secretion pathway protein M